MTADTHARALAIVRRLAQYEPIIDEWECWDCCLSYDPEDQETCDAWDPQTNAPGCLWAAARRLMDEIEGGEDV